MEIEPEILQHPNRELTNLSSEMLTKHSLFNKHCNRYLHLSHPQNKPSPLS